MSDDGFVAGIAVGLILSAFMILIPAITITKDAQDDQQRAHCEQYHEGIWLDNGEAGQDHERCIHGTSIIYEEGR